MRRILDCLIILIIIGGWTDLHGKVVHSSDVSISNDRRARWQGYVRNFRDSHNFSLALGLVSTRWTIRAAGALSEVSRESFGSYAKIRYSFHIPIWRNVGYFLGSSAGGVIERARSENDFMAASSVHLPGILVGLIVDVTPALRFGVGVDAYLERMDGMILSDEYYSTKLDINMVSLVDSMVFMDVFYDLVWAIRVELHGRHTVFWKPENRASGKVIDVQITRLDRWLGLGIVYHLL